MFVVVGFVWIAPKAAWVHGHPHPDAAEQLIKDHYMALGHYFEIGVYYPWGLFTVFYLLVCLVYAAVLIFKRLLRNLKA